LKHLLYILNEVDIVCTLFVVPDGFARYSGDDEFATCLKTAVEFGHEIAQHGYLHGKNKLISEFGCLLPIPEVIFYTRFPSNFFSKFKTKVRRANQLIGLWAKCLKLILKRHLSLPKRIAIPEIALFIFNPIIFFLLIVTGIATVILNPLSPLSLAIILSVAGLLVFARQIFIELFVDNIILLYALITFMFNQRYVAWEK
jgi:hypothetical protein